MARPQKVLIKTLWSESTNSLKKNSGMITFQGESFWFSTVCCRAPTVHLLWCTRNYTSRHIHLLSCSGNILKLREKCVYCKLSFCPPIHISHYFPQRKEVMEIKWRLWLFSPNVLLFNFKRVITILWEKQYGTPELSCLSINMHFKRI